MGIVAVFAVVLGIHELAVLFGIGFLVMLIQLMKRGRSRPLAFPAIPLLAVSSPTAAFGLAVVFLFPKGGFCAVW